MLDYSVYVGLVICPTGSYHQSSARSERQVGCARRYAPLPLRGRPNWLAAPRWISDVLAWMYLVQPPGVNPPDLPHQLWFPSDPHLSLSLCPRLDLSGVVTIVLFAQVCHAVSPLTGRYPLRLSGAKLIISLTQAVY